MKYEISRTEDRNGSKTTSELFGPALNMARKLFGTIRNGFIQFQYLLISDTPKSILIDNENYQLLPAWEGIEILPLNPSLRNADVPSTFTVICETSSGVYYRMVCTKIRGVKPA